MITLAGAAAAGKSTTCRLLGNCVEVEPLECHRLPWLERQLCFLWRFTEAVLSNWGRDVVLSNSLYTVAAYSACVPGIDASARRVLVEVAERLAAMLEPRAVALIAPPRTLMKRSRRRGARVEDVEFNPRVIRCVNDFLQARLPTVVTTKPPRHVAEEVRAILEHD